MAALINKLPGLARGDGPSVETRHQRLGSPPPSPHVEEEDVTHPDNELISPKKWKGKGKEVDRGEVDPVDSTPDGGARRESTGESYPPMNDEELETQRVQEVCIWVLFILMMR